jgi:hypothetical protein
MITIKVKTKNKGFSVPIPYTILNLGVSVISSSALTNLINKQTKNGNEKASLLISTPIDKKLLKQMIHELKLHKGTELVNVKAKDGTEIRITL